MVRGGWGWGLRLRRGQRLASCRFLEGHLSWIRCGWIVGFWVGILSFFSLNRRGKAKDGKVVYMTYTIFSKIPMMTDDDDEKRKRRE